ncbi:zinc finger protein 850-like [Anopheles aquasalis]|uniref:zinc finger protein 850-like n=1 Tax=Anopheles aquasalis TaxID=42839 RepID=UPI00215A3DDD|nr:zinc finger protein 850-like [Anopheles aquasalis]
MEKPARFSAEKENSRVVLWCDSRVVKLCRICSKPDNDDFISVRLRQEQVTIAEKIFAISGVEVMKDRRLPQNICLKCLDRVNEAFELRQQCIETDSHWCESLPDMNKLLLTGSPQHCGSESSDYFVEFLEEPTGERVDTEEDDEDGDPGEQDPHQDVLEQQSDSISEHGSITEESSCQTTQVVPNQAHTIQQNTAWRLGEHYQRLQPDCCGCTMHFESKEELFEHSLQVHRKQKRRSKYRPCQCPVCYRSYTSEEALAFHYIDFDRQYPANGGLYQCLTCNQTLKTYVALIEHLEHHHRSYGKNSCHEKSHAVEFVPNHPKSSTTSSDGSDLCIEIQTLPNDEQMEEDSEEMEIIDRSVTTETLDEEYVTDAEYLKVDDGSGKEEYEAFQDEVEDGSEVDYGDDDGRALEGESYRSQTSKAGRMKSKEQSALQRVLQIPEEYRRVVANQETYMIVELMHERCCCCAKFFATDQHLQEHMKQHQEEHSRINASRKQEAAWKYSCEYCGKTFKFAITYTFHLRIRQRRQFYLCGLCNLVMDTEKRMKSHMLRSEQHASFFNLPRADVSDQYFIVVLAGVRCCRCRTYFERHVDFNEHFQTTHSQQLLAESRHTLDTHPFECGVCKRRFTRKALIEQHLTVGTIETEENTRNFVKYCCKLCDYMTYTIERIEAHLYGAVHSDVLAKVHLEPLNNEFKKPDTMCYCCMPECKKSFLDTEILKAHFRDCHAETLAANQRANSMQKIEQGSYECFICALRLENLNALKDHQALRSPSNCICAICGIKKPSRSAMLDHERSHTGERPYRCELCDKTFASLSCLRSHQKCHVPREYECSTCNEQFARLENLKRHFRLKHGEATFKCEICAKMFKTRDKLSAHIRIHTGEKPYKCRTEGCDRWYTNTADRRRHEMAGHTLERPHPCRYCGAAFVRKRQLVIHERRHTGDRPYSCEKCGKTFVEATALRKHTDKVCSF